MNTKKQTEQPPTAVKVKSQIFKAFEKRRSEPQPKGGEPGVDQLYSNHERDIQSLKNEEATELQTADDPVSDGIAEEVTTLSHNGKYDEAIKLGEDRLAGFTHQPYDPTTLRIKVAKAYIKKASHTDNGILRNATCDKAITHLQKILHKEPNHMKAMQYLGDAYFIKEDFERAYAVYSKYAEAHPDDAIYAYSRILKICKICKDYETAEKIADKQLAAAYVLPAEPAQKRLREIAFAYSEKISLQVKQRKLSEANNTADEMITFLEKQPPTASCDKELRIAVFQKTSTLIKLHRNEEVISTADKYINTAVLPEAGDLEGVRLRIKICSMKEFAQRNLGQFEDAQTTCVYAVNLLKKHPNAAWRDTAMIEFLHSLAFITFKLGKREVALSYADEALTLLEKISSPQTRENNLGALLAIKAKAELSLDKLPEAEGTIKRRLAYIHQKPDDTHLASQKCSCLGMLATCLIRQGFIIGATDVIEELKKLEPDSTHVLVLSILLEMKQNRAERAYTMAKDLALNHEFNPAHMHMLRYAAYQAKKNDEYEQIHAMAQKDGIIPDSQKHAFYPIKTLTPAEEAALMENIGNPVGSYTRSPIFDEDGYFPNPVNRLAAKVSGLPANRSSPPLRRS